MEGHLFYYGLPNNLAYALMAIFSSELAEELYISKHTTEQSIKDEFDCMSKTNGV
jgi:hypothetical protein